MNACCSLKTLMRGRVTIPSVLDVWLHGLASDSRRVRSGMAFVALPGGSTNLWDNVQDAINRGASAVLLDADSEAPPYEYQEVVIVPVKALHSCAADLADHFHGHPSATLSVIGVTGTNGKSSVTGFLGQILNQCGLTTATMGTLGYGLPGSMEQADHTTPDAVRVQELLARFRGQGAHVVVMEVSSHALDQGRVDCVRFTGAVFTNLTPEHLDYHGSLAAYGASKARLFEDFEPEFAVINLDDDFGERLSRQLGTDVRLLRYGVGERAVEFSVREITRAQSTTVALIDAPMGELAFTTGLIGTFNISNMTAAVAAAIAMGVAVGDVLAAVPRVQGPPGRMESFRRRDGCHVVIDYAHTEDALGRGLSTLRPHTGGELWCVFGCGGNRDTAKRPAMGAVAERLADRVILTDDNPRHEASRRIIDDILSGMEDSARVRVIADRREAIETALSNAGSNDLVLIAGKGHEWCQERADKRLPFSDVELVRELLDQKGGAA